MAIPNKKEPMEEAPSGYKWPFFDCYLIAQVNESLGNIEIAKEYYHKALSLATFGEARWEQIYFQQKKGFNAHTIAWNRGEATKVWIDEVPHTFEANTVLPIMLNQSFRFEDGADIIGLQFDRNFYCLQNHDSPQANKNRVPVTRHAVFLWS